MSDPVPEYRKIPTRRGDYFVSWEPRHVEHLLHSENLSPHDLRLQDSRQAHRLIRDLFLLGVREEGLADTRGEQCASRISGFARELLGLYSHRHAV